MKILLLKCGICSTWYRPQARNGHCYYCNATPITLQKATTKYYNVVGNRAIEMVRGIDNPLRASVLNTLITRG